MIFVPLYGKHGRGRFFFVDSMDRWVCSERWYVHSKGYVYRFRYHDLDSGKGRTCFLARELMDPDQGFMVDHVNGNKLDNRRCNLRIVTNAQNLQNRHAVMARSGYRGVYPNPVGRWYGRVKISGISHNTRMFDTPEEANEAVIELRKQLLPYSTS